MGVWTEGRGGGCGGGGCVIQIGGGRWRFGVEFVRVGWAGDFPYCPSRIMSHESAVRVLLSWLVRTAITREESKST